MSTDQYHPSNAVNTQEINVPQDNTGELKNPNDPMFQTPEKRPTLESDNSSFGPINPAMENIDAEPSNQPPQPNYWRGQMNELKGTVQQVVGNIKQDGNLSSRGEQAKMDGKQEKEAAREIEDEKVERRENN
ncbi:hypothetical protein INT43_000114 [Umbelopsis isabellina]|uniref:CsbD-like domain-containing protein n=1 Tax=Mortierella isabellina TaxID=91625 RepID=A0A8H7PF27_MORIS|nr:hypothetical protein INT43_000114 [Umbelopsis isabellina]